MHFKEQLQRFRTWQKKPRQYAIKDSEIHRCACCNYEFEGNYCPVCGQRAGESRITWQSLWKNVIMLWGMDSHSMPYSLWQLLWRPGYFIGEYISGHRQVSYPPVKMLFILAVFYVIIRQILGFETEFATTSANNIFEITTNWFSENPGWAMMTMTMFFSIPTWFFFHFSPRHPKHTFPEGFFIQLFMASLVLICILIQKFLPQLILLIPIYYYVAYRQLFGYSSWSTLWRLALAAIVWTIAILFLATIALIFSNPSTDSISIGVLLMLVITFLLFITIPLFAGYWISKWTEKKRLQKADIHGQSKIDSPVMVK